MIFPEDITPEKSLYIMGGRILGLLKKERGNMIDPKTIYEKYRVLNPNIEISYNYFLYALDWLFILNSIEITPEAKIKKCF